MTRVMVVDDSALMRRLIGGVLTEAGCEVHLARNGAEALVELERWEPDVVTLDINMPEMDGLTALSLMMQTRPTPVVMVSSLTAKGAMATLEAMAMGAVDFIEKPGGTMSVSLGDMGPVLVAKVKAAARAKVRRPVNRATPERRPTQTPTRAAPAAATRVARDNLPNTAPAPASAAQRLKAASATALLHCPGVVLVGVSTGGPRTLEDILPQLPANFPWPVVVAQHMPSYFTSAFAVRMNGLCALRVAEVDAVKPLMPGHIYIGRGGTDMILAERLGRVVVMPQAESPKHPWHPSVDVMVDSALDLLPPARLIGVQLTGMGYDGAAAMTRLHQRGGRTLAESEDTAVVFGMPAELIQRGGAGVVKPCHEVAAQLTAWLPALSWAKA